TGAYSAETPGGWQLIGRTPVGLFDPSADPPTPMQAGDSVHFAPIQEEEYQRLDAEYAERQAPDAGGSNPQSAIRNLQSPPAVLEVLEPGLLTTVQDRGRFGYMKFGVPVSGAVDPVALRLGNVLVGNSQGAAALEFTLMGPRVRLLADTVLALTGAEVRATLDGAPVPWYESFQAGAGQVLEVGPCQHGVRGYLAVAGGLDVPVLLRSRSTCLAAGFGGVAGRPLAAGDVLAAGPVPDPLERVAGFSAPQSWRPGPGGEVTLRVVMGPQADAFTEAGLRTFLTSTYQVSARSDRMGCRLEGPHIEHRGAPDILSDWIPLGGIQVPGDGKPIILLADRQTTGGYTKIASVISPDLGVAAQRRPGDAVRFRAISIQDAQTISRNLEKRLARIPLLRSALWQELAESGEAPGDLGGARPSLA
ncbi:MAG TPA: 5-oxoprolinase/urea amidolyase family protein, partial [Candidatus Sulfotelmatobacter sp.]|nr:5-oxoprolinase/urea amidolyase family protein [Candidatus Sulfotelmatobacter sp.]